MRWSVSLVVLAIACGGVERPGSEKSSKFCTAATCPDGCCDTNDVCRSGTDPWVCGGGGNACEICMGRVSCTNRKCVPEAPYDAGSSAGGGSGGYDAGSSAGGGSGGYDAGSGSGGGSGSSGGPSGHLYCETNANGCVCTYVPVAPKTSNPSCTPASAGTGAKCCSALGWPNDIQGYCGCYKNPNTCNFGGLTPETRCN